MKICKNGICESSETVAKGKKKEKRKRKAKRAEEKQKRKIWMKQQRWSKEWHGEFSGNLQAGPEICLYENLHIWQHWMQIFPCTESDDEKKNLVSIRSPSLIPTDFFWREIRIEGDIIRAKYSKQVSGLPQSWMSLIRQGRVAYGLLFSKQWTMHRGAGQWLYRRWTLYSLSMEEHAPWAIHWGLSQLHALVMEANSLRPSSFIPQNVKQNARSFKRSEKS